MILEIAHFDILEGKELPFSEACLLAQKIISQSPGFINVEFQQCVETSTRFLALIKWEKIEDHTIGFRQSQLFLEWRAVLSPFFKSAPIALHYNLI